MLGRVFSIQPGSRRGRRLHAMTLLLTALAIAVLGHFILSWLDQAALRNPEATGQMPATARYVIDHRSWLAPLCVPVLLCSVLLWHGIGGRALAWAMTALASLWLSAVFVMILYAFVQFLAPMYQYQPI